jgi:hypothetical protein
VIAVRRTHSKLNRFSRRVAFAIAGLSLAVAVLAGAWRSSSSLVSGGRYFYCEAMGFLQADPCAVRSHHDAARDPGAEAREQPFDCCAVGTLDSAPSGTLARARTVSPPALVAIIAPWELVEPRSPNDVRCSRIAHERWRPPPRTATQRRSELMVFLT